MERARAVLPEPAVSGKASDPGSAWFGAGGRSASAVPGPGHSNARLITTAVAAFVSVLGLALFLHLYVCHVRRRNRRRAASVLPTAAAAAPQPKGGLDPSAIAALPVAVYKKSGDAGGCATECSICLGAVQEGDAVRVLPACAHVFHVPCVDTWLASSASCPVCRAGVEPPPPPPGSAAWVHEKLQDAVKEEAGSSAPARGIGASLMKMLSRERPSGRRPPGANADDAELDDLERQQPQPQQQQQHAVPVNN